MDNFLFIVDFQIKSPFHRGFLYNCNVAVLEDNYAYHFPNTFPVYLQLFWGFPLGGFKFDNGWDQQMSYTWASDRWVMPAPYYKTSVVYADLGFDVDYYFLDSNFVDAKPPEDVYAYVYVFLVNMYKYVYVFVYVNVYVYVNAYAYRYVYVYVYV